MYCSEDCSLLNALDVSCSMSHGPRGSSFDTKSSSERGHKKRRWSPYTKKRKLLPKKSFSLETIPLLPHIERSQSFELTQSIEDQTSVKSESTMDLESDCITVAEPDQATDDSLLPTLEDEFIIDLEDYSNVADTDQVEWLLPTLKDEFSICLENDYSASTIQPITECLYRSMESELTFEHGNVFKNDAETSQPTVSFMQSMTEPPDTSQDKDSSVIRKSDQSLTEWLLWSAYAKLLKLSWRNTREILNEQTHRAENCELQAKSTMTQVYSMKTKLKADISEMKENVIKIRSMRLILGSNEEEEKRLQTENDNLKAKIECLNEGKSQLKQEISKADQAIGEFHAEADSIKIQIKVLNDEMAELEAERVVLDGEIHRRISITEQAKENETTGQKNIHNRQLEISHIEWELAASKEKIAIEKRMVQTVRDQAQVISKEIEIAAEGAETLQKQLAESREKVLNRDSMIAELIDKVASAEEQISRMKGSIETAERKGFLRRFQFLPKDNPSLLSIKL